MPPASFPIRVCQALWKLYRYAVPESVGIIRRHGWRELVRQRGWKFLAAIVAYYLIRDIVIYVIVPLCIARGILKY